MSIFDKKALEKARLFADAEKALNRAQKAMFAANRSPYSDCKIQEKAAWAEVECALALIEEARS